jgi:D-3-phosphoglycerate dehydrogenase
MEPKMAPKVLVSDELSETAVQIFRDRGVEVDYLPKLGKDKDALAAVIGQYDGLAIRSATKVTEKLLALATKLKVVGRAGIGVDNVDIPAASKKGVIVMNTPFGNSITTAEHAIAMMFAVARQIPEANASTHAGKWEKSRFMGVELFNKTLGVIGAGNIGGIVCDRALGLKMKVVAYDPFLSDERARLLGVTKVELDDLLARADFITLHVPLTEKTRNILSAGAIARCKPGMRLINCARGGLVDEVALAAALISGHVAGRTRHGVPPVQSAQCGRHPPPWGCHDRGTGKRGAAGGRTDGRLPADRGGAERAEHAVGHGGRGRRHGPLGQAGRASGCLRRPDDGRADQGDQRAL